MRRSKHGTDSVVISLDGMPRTAALDPPMFASQQALYTQDGRIVERVGPTKEVVPLAGIHFFDAWRVDPCCAILSFFFAGARCLAAGPPYLSLTYLRTSRESNRHLVSSFFVIDAVMVSTFRDAVMVSTSFGDAVMVSPIPTLTRTWRQRIRRWRQLPGISCRA